MKRCTKCGTSQTDGLFCSEGHVLLTDPPDDLLIGRILEGRYEVRSALGAGGFGMVYLAADLRLKDRPCVVKVAKPELVQEEVFAARFEREKAALMKLRSGNTVQIIDHGREPDGIDYIVMEYVDGKDLSKLLRREGRLTQARAIHIAQGICTSAIEAHGLGILHRDLKPANVMLAKLGASEQIKVIDFGIAKLLHRSERGVITNSGEIPGTPAYSSYEQFVGQADQVDKHSDIYSLGAIIYEMLTGHIPYGDRVTLDQFDSSTLYFIALAKAKAEDIPLPVGELVPEVDPMLEQLVMKMLDISPDKRPSTMREVSNLLTRISLGKAAEDAEIVAGDTFPSGLAGGPTEDLEVPAATSQRTKRRLKRGILATAIFLVLAGMSIAALMVNGLLDNEETIAANEGDVKASAAEVERPPKREEDRQVEVGDVSTTVGAKSAYHRVDVASEDALSEAKGRADIEEEWEKVREVATDASFPFDDRMAIVKQFLANYPHDNPFAAGAEKLEESIPSSIVEWVFSKPAKLLFAKNETTVSQYQECVKAGACTSGHYFESSSKPCNLGKKGRGDHPMNCVKWDGAMAFCDWVGGRLPSEDEWYAEASNKGRRKYPWGDSKGSCQLTVWGESGEPDGCGKKRTWKVCSKSAGNSVSGLCDMSGNVWEWTSTRNDGKRNPLVLCGGAWNSVRSTSPRAKGRYRATVDGWHSGCGFRCVRSLLP
jgi:serine/threonine protein kinase